MLTAADSGTATTKVVYENYAGEAPVFSGGMRVTSWTNTSGNTWKATLPASTQYFENLSITARGGSGRGWGRRRGTRWAGISGLRIRCT